MSIPLLQLVVPAPLDPPRVPTGPSSLLRSEAHDSSYNSLLVYIFLISPAHWPQRYPNPPGPQLLLAHKQHTKNTLVTTPCVLLYSDEIEILAAVLIIYLSIWPNINILNLQT